MAEPVLPYAPPQAQSNVRGWIVTLAALGINLASGTLYAWTVLGNKLRKDHGWKVFQTALPFAVATMTFALTMIFAGRMQDKIGPRRIALLGGIVLGSGFILAAFAPTPPLMAAAFAVVGIGIGLAYSATTPAAIKWFPASKKGLITGIVVSGIGLAAVYASPLANYLLAHISIFATLLILGIATIVSICGFAILVTNPPAGHVPPGAAPSGSAATRAISPRDMDWPDMLCTHQFYLLWIMFVLAAAPGLMIISQVVTIADLQAKWPKAFALAMVLAAFNAAGRVVGGFVSDWLGRTNTMVLAFVLQAVNMFFFVHYTSPALMLFGAAFAGLCYGTVFCLMPAASADFYGVRNFGVNFGLLFTAFGVAGSFGSLLGGKVADLCKGSYFWAYMVVGVMLLVAAVLALITRAPEVASAEPALAAAGAAR